jgi:hypothetical protein
LTFSSQRARTFNEESEMGYVALKPLKVQLAGARKITLVQPGERVPGAERWPNIKVLIKRGAVSFVEDDKAPPKVAVPSPAAPSVSRTPVPRTLAPPPEEDEPDEPEEHHDEPKKAHKKEEPKKAQHTHKLRR